MKYKKLVEVTVKWWRYGKKGEKDVIAYLDPMGSEFYFYQDEILSSEKVGQLTQFRGVADSNQVKVAKLNEEIGICEEMLSEAAGFTDYGRWQTISCWFRRMEALGRRRSKLI